MKTCRHIILINKQGQAELRGEVCGICRLPCIADEPGLAYTTLVVILLAPLVIGITILLMGWPF